MRLLPLQADHGERQEDHLLVGTADGALRAVKVRAKGKPEVVWSREGLHQGPVTCVAVLCAPEGLVVSGCTTEGADSSLVVVDGLSGSTVKTLGEGGIPRGGVQGLAVSRENPDSTRILVAGSASAVLLSGDEEKCAGAPASVKLESPAGGEGGFLVALSPAASSALIAARGASEVCVFEVCKGGTRRKPTEELKLVRKLQLGLAAEALEILGGGRTGAGGEYVAALGAGGACEVVEIGATDAKDRSWKVDLSGGDVGSAKSSRSRKRKSPPGGSAAVFSAALDDECE